MQRRLRVTGEDPVQIVRLSYKPSHVEWVLLPGGRHLLVYLLRVQEVYHLGGPLLLVDLETQTQLELSAFQYEFSYALKNSPEKISWRSGWTEAGWLHLEDSALWHLPSGLGVRADGEVLRDRKH